MSTALTSVAPTVLSRALPTLSPRATWKAAQAGDWATVKAEQDRLNEISHIWDVTSGVQGYAGGVGAFKTAMNLMGIFDSPTMPRPVKAMTGENVEAIRKVLQDNGLL